MHEGSHVLRDPDFHDGALTGVRVIDRSVLELSCSTVDGGRYLLSLSGLECLRADNFLQGNIIFELRTFNSDLPLDLVRKAFGIQEGERPNWLEPKLVELSTGHWTLLELSSSYGCDLTAIGRGEVTIERLD